MTAHASVALNENTTLPGTTMRFGDEYLRSLDDGRAVFVDGERIASVTKHPAFAGAARSCARLFDIAADPAMAERMTYVTDEGTRALRAYQIPRSHADLRAKRLASETWSESTFGMIGRTPDHVAGFFAGYAAVPEVFAAGGQGFADNVTSFYKHLRDNHLWATYAIVPPQIDRSKPAHQQSDPTLYAGVVKERDGGIVLAGAQQLATAGLYSDYLYLSCIHPLRPGDENYAIGVAIPMNAEGLRLYPRRPFAKMAENSFDHPLSSRFDESDCFVVLDNVFVPWEHVFIYRNLEVCRDQWWKTPSHAYGNLQAQARYITKLRFMIGLAKRMNEMTGNDAAPPVMIEMGELAALVSIVETMLEAQELKATIDDKGVVWPSKQALYAVMSLQSELNPRMIEIIREITGAAMITMPSSLKDFDSPVTAPDIERFMQSGTASARDRAALMRMAWDFIGSEFGNRHQQYEKFYGGASFLVKQNMYRSFDFKRATGLVDSALALGI
ncbi:4-hydroxyphenylacetate 3-hydroxylase family protein [Methylobacterium gnaphalii]|uniref:4-hydroxyphenylacetate 3-monooxygenase oxygenase component n=1 Tax=Methylobacterium gnaphalii TaxID=1010610 RepID=A0A512JQ15_9HYPH|nr:4-hydroxyphenylacetate 3-hydroxylase N-terminal domain-containing protein [Methylobacterium gnaphalii]GEP12038.1 4-hydroxyphenylacetate 3-monooxygenase oxygenase component [Methylobacterium gnaphalii]GJD71618.1 Anthranilate 3-monooxygenase oxygenase component [Methylobacterium gnaphalii]